MRSWCKDLLEVGANFWGLTPYKYLISHFETKIITDNLLDFGVIL